MNRESARPIKRGWLGIPSVLSATAANLRFLAAPQPGTPLRVLSLIAITASLRSRGVVMVPEQKRALIEAMELGAMLNDRFDGDPHDRADLCERISWFAGSSHRSVVWNYAKSLRRLEHSRPDSGDTSGAVRHYRENVNRVSLAALWALANSNTLGNAELEIIRDPDLQLLFRIVMMTQLIDDVIDASLDRRRNLPSFATVPDASHTSLREIESAYADATPIRFDENFCLQVALKTISWIARALISIRTS